MSRLNMKALEETNMEILKIVPRGLGKDTGLEQSIPAVRVWGIINFERAFSGNEASGMNEAFTDAEPFLMEESDNPEFDARARIRATKFNYIRESRFRELIRRVCGPYLQEIANKPKTTGVTQLSESVDKNIYENIVEKVFADILSPIINDTKELRSKLENYKAFFKALLIKMATCSPTEPCGACPACIGEGSAATTSEVGVSIPHNWEKKYKETDFKTFRTVKSAALDLGLNVDGVIIEPGLTESLVRNRMPREGAVEVSETVEKSALSGQTQMGAQMILREHMFKGSGYVKTTLFNPTKLELAMLAYEYLVEEVRKGAKTSSGAGVWGVSALSGKDGHKVPLLVVDEILGLRGFILHKPQPAIPLEVRTEKGGIQTCFLTPLSLAQIDLESKTLTYDLNGNEIKDEGNKQLVLVRHIGQNAIGRLRSYFTEIASLEPTNDEERQETFKLLVEYAASVIAKLITPKKALQKIIEEFKTQQKKATEPEKQVSEREADESSRN